MAVKQKGLKRKRTKMGSMKSTKKLDEERKSVREQAQAFTQQTTMHGVQYIGKTDISLPRR